MMTDEKCIYNVHIAIQHNEPYDAYSKHWNTMCRFLIT